METSERLRAGHTYQGAVHIEPPVADEVLLVEDCPVWTEEAGPEEPVSAVTGAHVV